MADPNIGNIPHRGPMRWLDSASVKPDGWIIGRHVVAADHPFVIKGRLIRAALIELIAQTAAAGSPGFGVGMSDGTSAFGMLIGLRNVEFYGDVGAGETLECRVRVTQRVGDMFRCEGRCFRGAELMCGGIFSFFAAGSRAG